MAGGGMRAGAGPALRETALKAAAGDVVGCGVNYGTGKARRCE